MLPSSPMPSDALFDRQSLSCGVVKLLRPPDETELGVLETLSPYLEPLESQWTWKTRYPGPADSLEAWLDGQGLLRGKSDQQPVILSFDEAGDLYVDGDRKGVSVGLVNPGEEETAKQTRYSELLSRNRDVFVSLDEQYLGKESRAKLARHGRALWKNLAWHGSKDVLSAIEPHHEGEQPCLKLVCPWDGRKGYRTRDLAFHLLCPHGSDGFLGLSHPLGIADAERSEIWGLARAGRKTILLLGCNERLTAENPGNAGEHEPGRLQRLFSIPAKWDIQGPFETVEELESQLSTLRLGGVLPDIVHYAGGREDDQLYPTSDPQGTWTKDNLWTWLGPISSGQKVSLVFLNSCNSVRPVSYTHL